MSILKSVINSLKAAISNDAFDNIQLADFRKKIKDAIKAASADHSITAEEIAEIKSLVDKLEINDSELNEIRILVMQDLVTLILADNKITEDEMALFEQISDKIDLSAVEEEKLKENFEKVKNMYEEAKK